MPDLSYLDKYLKPGEGAAAKPLDYLDSYLPKPEPSIVSEGLKAPARVVGGIAQEAGEAAQYVTGNRVGGGLRRYGEKVQEANAVDPRFAEAHPVVTAVGGAAESVARMAPYLAADAAVSLVAPPAGAAGLAGILARGAAKAALPAVIGASTGQRSYELAEAQGASPSEALKKSLLPAAVSTAGMALMGPLGRAGRGLLPKVAGEATVKSIINPSTIARDVGGAVLADTPVMMGTAAATAAAQQAVGIKPEKTPTEILKDPKEWVSSALAGGMFGALHAAQRSTQARAFSETLTNPEIDPELRRKVVNYVGSQLPAESRDAWLAQAHDAVKRGEAVPFEPSVLPQAEPTPSPVETQADIVQGLVRSVETGESPVEALTAGKQEDALSAITAEIDKAHAPAASKADRFIQAGSAVTARGKEIDPSTRAELEARGYVAVDAGSPKDGRPRRNWEILPQEEYNRRLAEQEALLAKPEEPPVVPATETREAPASEAPTLPEGEQAPAGVEPPRAFPDVESWKKSLAPDQLAEVNDYENLRYKSVALQGPEKGYKPYKLTAEEKARFAELHSKYAGSYLTPEARSLAAQDRGGDSNGQRPEVLDQAGAQAPAEPLSDGEHRFLNETQTEALQRKGDQVALGAKNPTSGAWERVALAEKNPKGEWVVDAAGSESPEAAARMVSALRTAGLEVGTKFSTKENSASLTAEHVQRAFPKQEVRSTADGYEVSTRSGAKIRISEVGDISFDRAEVEAAHGPLKDGERPVASFTKLGKEGIISLTEKGVGELDHEAFHAAVALSLSQKEIAQVLKKYGTEEAAAKAYQKFRDGSAPATGWWNRIKELVTRLRDLVLPNADTVFRKLASGEAWKKAKAQGGSALTRYMVAAWHGSPHDFDKFTTDKIGTGEGAQAYGHGLYFAGSKAVAEYYRDQLSKDIDLPDSAIKTALETFIGKLNPENYDSVEKDLVTTYTQSELLDLIRNSDGAQLRGIFSDLTNSKKWGEIFQATLPKGRLYQVELAPKEDEYLLWDKPLSEQSETVKAALEDVKDMLGDQLEEYEYQKNADFDEWTGGELVKQVLRRAADDDYLPNKPAINDALEAGRNDAAISAYLHSLGIRGIKYLDGTSRGKGEGEHNYVIFNDEDVKVVQKFSLGRDKEAVEAASEPVLRTELSRVLKGAARGLYNHIFPVDRVINLAVSSAEYRPIKKELLDLQKWQNIKGQYAQGVVRNEAVLYDKHVAPTIKTDADLQNFNKALYIPSLYQLSETGNEWTDRSWKRAGLQKATGKTLPEARAEAKAAIAALTPEQRQARAKVLEHVQTLRQDHLQALEDNIRGLFSGEVVDKARELNKAIDDAHFVLSDEALHAEVARLRAAAGPEAVAIAEPIAQLDATKKLKGDYFPLMRFGDHVVAGEVDGKPYRRQFDTQLDARKELAKLQAAGGDVRYDYQNQVSMREEAHIPLNFLEKYRSILETRGIEGPRADNVMNDLKALWVNTLSQYNFRNHLLQRKSVAGFEEDAHKTFLTYARRYGQAIANTRYGGKVDQLFRDMSGKIDTVSAEGGAPESITLMRKLYDQLYKQHTSTDQEQLAGVTKVLTRTTFLYYLTSPSVLAVQWSQPFMTTIPQLSVKHGMTAAMGAFSRGARKYIAGHYSDAKLDAFEERTGGVGEKTFRLMEELWSLPDTATGVVDAAKARLEGDIQAATERGASAQELASLRARQTREMAEITRQATAEQEARKSALSSQVDSAYAGLSKSDQELLTLNLMARQGLRDLSISHNAFDAMLSSGSVKGLAEKAIPGSGKAWNKVMELLALPMQKSETGSRTATAIAALELARSKGMNYVDAHAYARDVITDTLFNFSRANRPGWMQGNVGTIVGQFQLYRFNMLGKVFQTTKDAIGADYKERLAAAQSDAERAALKQERDDARKELAYMTGMGMALAGAAGTPLSMVFGNSVTSAMWEGLKLLFEDPDDPWDPEATFENAVRESVGDTAGTAFLKGLPTLLGWDISKRVGASGMADFIQGDPPPGLTGTARANWYAGRILGPSWGMVSDGFRAMEAAQSGDVAGAVQMSAPKFYRDFAKTLAASEKGVQGGGKTLVQPEDVGPYQMALMMLGINPIDISLAQESAREIRGMSADLSARRSLLLKKFSQAQVEGDFDAREEALQSIAEWGRKQPKMKITGGDLISAYKREMRSMAGTESAREKMLREQREEK